MGQIIYKINERPKPGLAILGGFQHVLTLFGATTLVPLIFAPQIGMTQQETAIFISSVYLAMGIATLIQISVLGSSLPIVQGSSFSFIPAILTIISDMKAKGTSMIMRAISGALIAGGLAEAIVGYSKIIGYIKKFITPVVIGPTIMLIGFSLAPVAVETSSHYWPIAILVVSSIFLLTLLTKSIRIFSILISILIGYTVALIGSLSGIISSSHPAYVNFQAIKDAKALIFPAIFRWGTPIFNLKFFFVIIAAYIASIIESIGDYHSVAMSAEMAAPDKRVISKGIGAEGISCMISGVLGGVGTTSYTENIGVINITGIASRFVIMIGAIILILMSFIGKFAAIIATIPAPVIGGTYLALFGVIGAIGIQAVSKADLTSERNLMIIGFSFLLGLGLPVYMKQHALNFTPKFLCDIFNAIFSTGMAVGGLTAGILDNILPGTDKERGLV